MTPDARISSSRLRRLYVSASVAAVVAVALLAALTVPLAWPPAPTALLLLGVGLISALAYAGFVVRRTVRVVRQLRFEDRFAEQHLGGRVLAACLERDDHVWGRSRLRAGVREALSVSRPTLVPEEERRRRLQNRLRIPLRPYCPHPVRALLALTLVTLGTLGAASAVAAPGAPARAPDPSSLWMVGFLAAVAWHLGALLLARAAFRRYVAAAAAWTQRCGLASEPAAPSPQPYRHTLLYRAAPWSTALPTS